MSLANIKINREKFFLTIIFLILIILLNNSYANNHDLIYDLANREINKRAENSKKAAQLLSEALAESQKKNYQKAVNLLTDSANLVTDAPATRKIKLQILNQHTKNSLNLAKELINFGKKDEALSTINNAQKLNPDNKNKKFQKFAEHLQDKTVFNPAYDENHVNKKTEIIELLTIANDQSNIGLFDSAIKNYNKILNIDPYNKAARIGLEKVNNHQNDYQKTAYAQTRSKLINDINAGWELPYPKNFNLNNSIKTHQLNNVKNLESKTKSIIFPRVQFNSTSLNEVITYIINKSKELDKDNYSSSKGVNIIIDESKSSDDSLKYRDKLVSFSLSNAPLHSVLKYVAQSTGMKVEYEDYAIVLIPQTSSTTKYSTRTWIVPPFFLSTNSDNASETEGSIFDSNESKNSVTIKRKDVKSFFEENNIEFPQGSSIFYSFNSNKLICTNTENNLDKIAHIVENFKTENYSLIKIDTTMIDVSQTNLRETGLDWLIGQFNIPGSKRVFGSGGTLGNQRNIPPGINQDYPYLAQGSISEPIGTNHVTSGLRSGTYAIQKDSLDALVEQTSDVPPALSPSLFSIAGVFTDPQFQAVIRALKQTQSGDVITRPSILVKPGQTAKIKNVKEFIYATEYDPPQVSNEIRNGVIILTVNGIPVARSGSPQAPITPATPTTFETRDVGVSLEVQASINPDQYHIDLDIKPELSKFEGFVNYGTPILNGGSSSAESIQNNEILMPVFKVIKSNNNITVADGQTIVLGALHHDDIEHTQDKVPFLGSLPIFGKLFQTEVKQKITRHIIIFVTARILDPGGNPMNSYNNLNEPKSLLTKNINY